MYDQESAHDACPLCQLGCDPSHPDFERGMCHEDCLEASDRTERRIAARRQIEWLYTCSKIALRLAREFTPRGGRTRQPVATFAIVREHRNAIAQLRAELNGQLQNRQSTRDMQEAAQ